MNIEFAVMVLFMKHLSVEAFGLTSSQCYFPKENSCLNPGLETKNCFCLCLTASINREFLKVDFTPCMSILRQCSMYKFKIRITFKDEKNEEIAGGETQILINSNQSTQTFPVYELTNLPSSSEPYVSKLQLDQEYTVSIQPKCSICDRCSYIEDMVIPPVINTEAEPTQNTSNWVHPSTVALVIGVAGIITVLSVISLIIFLRKRRATTGRVPLLQPMNNNARTYVNIIPLLGTDLQMVEELKKLIESKCNCRIINPSQLVLESADGQYCINTEMLYYNMNLLILTDRLISQFLRQYYGNISFEDFSVIIFNEFLKNSKSYTNVCFASFESTNIKLTAVNLDKNNILGRLANKLYDLSNSSMDRAKILDWLNRDSNETCTV